MVTFGVTEKSTMRGGGIVKETIMVVTIWAVIAAGMLAIALSYYPQ